MGRRALSLLILVVCAVPGAAYASRVEAGGSGSPYIPYVGHDSAGKVSFTEEDFTEPHHRSNVSLHQFTFATPCRKARTRLRVPIKVKHARWNFHRAGIRITGRFLTGRYGQRAKGTITVDRGTCHTGTLAFTAHEPGG